MARLQTFIVRIAISLLGTICHLVHGVTSTVHNKGTIDYCLLDKFNPQCDKNEVIIINSALFGRMKSNPCISREIGPMGCFTDVKDLLQGFCGGKETCNVVLGDPALLSTRPCGGNFNLYITVSHSCLEVHGPPDRCDGRSSPAIMSNSGYLASTVTSGMRQGSSQCSWKIKSELGQQLNVTIQRFPSISSQGKSSNPPVCHLAASVKEATTTKNILLCPSDARNKSIYLSQSDEVELAFSQDQAENAAVYLIHYQAVGCKNPEEQEDTNFKRQGNTATVLCKNSKVSWELICRDNTWEGDDKPCIEGWAFASAMGSDEAPPLGVLLIIVTGIALGVLIGGFLLYLAINAFKRYHGLLPGQQIQNPSYEKPLYNPNNKLANYNDRTIQRSSMIYGTNRRSYPNRQMPPPVPPPHADTAQMRPPSEISEVNRQSHIYETPLFNSH